MLTKIQPAVELWGGLECTICRVGDKYSYQLVKSGHISRESDLDLFARLGIKALRYPLLWEQMQPGAAPPDWTWSDARLARLRSLNNRPILGLVHHGSGPEHTSLIDPSFATGLAEYARAAAQQYPWVCDYTPINEPLTTARFSGLYGHWYPHGRDGLTFARILLNECRAVVLSMQAIRTINRDARLVQTDDIGYTFSTPALQYQADFENERRWITWDLLSGRVNREHPMWEHLVWLGVDEAEIAWFLDHPCPPDLIGLNYYVTSERYLDENLEPYPQCSHGGNGRQAYADVEAVRAVPAGLLGVQKVLEQAYARYRSPLAITEAHLACTREEQMRWFLEIWQAANAAKEKGADVRAVTAWSLLGAYDWNSLLTCCNGCYEPGVFDLRSPAPRPTAVAKLIQTLSAGDTAVHPVLDGPGWWRRPERLLYPAPKSNGTTSDSAAKGRQLLITGATGTLGQAFGRICVRRGLAHQLVTHSVLDIADPDAVEEMLRKVKPWAVVNAAGYVRVDRAEFEPEQCFRVNTDGTANLARICEKHGVRLLTFSSDMVFDGRSHQPYQEGDRVGPLNVYGSSKVAAEEKALSAFRDALVIRTSSFFGPWDHHNFVTNALRMIAAGESVLAVEDVVVSPTYVPDLVDTSLDLLIDGESGLWHLTNGTAVSWADLARRAAELSANDPAQVKGCSATEFPFVARRPEYSALTSCRANLLPSLDDALKRYFADRV
ncbi:MAG: dTDP-4-dehydrorhamnose reductase [Gemmataceae bacterium]